MKVFKIRKLKRIKDKKMKRKIFIIIALFLFMVQGHLSIGQFTASEIMQRPEIEEFLKTAEIVRFEDIPKGVTKPSKLYLRKGEVEIAGAWKNPMGMQQGYLEGWQYEIAAYEMDKLLGLHMVPPAVEKKFKGKSGSLSFWVTTEMDDLERMEKNIPIPQDKLDYWSKMKYLGRAFDCLIGNDDRTQENIRYTKDWRMILIDHSRSFRCTEEWFKNLPYGKNGIKGVKLFRQLSREFVEKVKALDFDSIKKAVGSYLEDEEIKAVLARKELFLKEVEEMIKEQGEDKVLY